MKLEVGKKYKTRDGLAVEIIEHIPQELYPFKGNYSKPVFGRRSSWLVDGRAWDDEITSVDDLIEEVSEFDEHQEALNKFDVVKKAKHYNKHPSGIECIDVIRHMNFNLGNAMKYIWRCDEKNDAIEDLEKAIYYIQDEIKKRKGVK